MKKIVSTAQISFIRKIIKNKITQLSVLIFILSLLPKPIPFLTILLMPILIISAWEIFNGFSKITNYIYCFILSSAVYSVIAILFFFFNIAFISAIGTLSTIIVIVIIGLYLRKGSLPKPNNDKWLDSYDFFSISIATVLVCIMASSVFGSGIAGLIREATTGFDNAQHTSLAMSTYDKGGYIYGHIDEIKNDVIYLDRGDYPKAWHLITAYNWKLFSSKISLEHNPASVLIIYYLTRLFYLWLIIFVFCRLILMIAEKNIIKKVNYNILVAAGSTTVFSFVLYFSTIMSSGFAPFSLTILLMLFSIMHIMSSQSLKKDLIIASFILVCGSFSWTLSLIYFGLYIFYFIGTYKISAGENTLFSHFKNIFIPVSIALLISSFALIQLYFQHEYSVKPNNLNEDGGIIAISSLLILSMFTITVLSLLNTKNAKQLHQFLYIFSISSILPSLVYLYQMGTAGRTTYYYTKSLGMLLVVLLIFFGSVVIRLFDRYGEKNNPIISTIVLFALFGCLISLTNTNLSQTIKYTLGKGRTMSKTTSEELANKLSYISKQKPLVVIYRKDNPSEDLIGSIYANMITVRYDNCQVSIISALLYYYNDSDRIENITNKCSENNKVYIIK